MLGAGGAHFGLSQGRAGRGAPRRQGDGWAGAQEHSFRRKGAGGRPRPVGAMRAKEDPGASRVGLLFALPCWADSPTPVNHAFFLLGGVSTRTEDSEGPGAGVSWKEHRVGTHTGREGQGA